MHHLLGSKSSDIVAAMQSLVLLPRVHGFFRTREAEPMSNLSKQGEKDLPNLFVTRYTLKK